MSWRRLLGVRALRRRPFEYRSSAPLSSSSGRTDAAAQGSLAKRADRAGARCEARLHARPAREIEVYRSLARRTPGSAPRARSVPSWIRTETGTGWWSRRWTGTELYQVGELERWQQVARWLARLHDRFAGTATREFLLRYDRSYLALWPSRAGERCPATTPSVDRLAALRRRSSMASCTRRTCCRRRARLRRRLGARRSRPGSTRPGGADQRVAGGGREPRWPRATGPRSRTHRTRSRSDSISTARGSTSRSSGSAGRPTGRRRRSTPATGGRSCRSSRSASACEPRADRQRRRFRPQRRRQPRRRPGSRRGDRHQRERDGPPGCDRRGGSARP